MPITKVTSSKAKELVTAPVCRRMANSMSANLKMVNGMVRANTSSKKGQAIRSSPSMLAAIFKEVGMAKARNNSQMETYTLAYFCLASRMAKERWFIKRNQEPIFNIATKVILA